MLKGGTTPSLLHQKLERWYSAHSGVFLIFLLGLLMSMLDSCVNEMMRQERDAVVKEAKLLYMLRDS